MASWRKDFLSQPAPENYVAGLGRGATGFTTRSDLGPAREGPTPEQLQAALAKRADQLGTAPPTAYGASREKGGKEDEKEEEDDERFRDPDNEVGLFAYGQFDQEDDEADWIYREVDERMDRRRKSRRLVYTPSPTRIPNSSLFIGSSPLCGQNTDMKPSSRLGRLESSRNKKTTNARTPRSSSSSPT
jgi:pre-mRNA-processing factor 6